MGAERIAVGFGVGHDAELDHVHAYVRRELGGEGEEPGFERALR